jgi:hypothetical protein
MNVLFMLVPIDLGAGEAVFLGVIAAEGRYHGGEVWRGRECNAAPAAAGADAPVPDAGLPSINRHTLSIFQVTCYHAVMSDLTKELYAYLVSHMYSVSYERRSRGYWVMSQQWWAEINRLAGPDGRPVTFPLASMLAGHDDVLFGLPVHVTADGDLPRLAGPGIPPPGKWKPVRRYA